MSPVEVEVKFFVIDPDALDRQLRSIGFQEITPSTFERNILFDTPEHRLRSAREVLRIRRYGDKWVLTHKCLPADHDPDKRHKHRVETETEVADGEAVTTILRALGFRESLVYEKWRTEYADARGHCVVDRTPIGVYAELEGPDDWIDTIARELDLAPDTLLTLSYGRIFERWKTETGSKAANLTFAECQQA